MDKLKWPTLAARRDIHILNLVKNVTFIWHPRVMQVIVLYPLATNRAAKTASAKAFERCYL